MFYASLLGAWRRARRLRGCTYMETSKARLSRRASEATGSRMPAVVDAFLSLFQACWPEGVPALTARVGPSPYQWIEDAFSAVHAAHPSAAFWWKDESSVFLGACERFGLLAGLACSADLIGLREGDPKLAWARQSSLYRRDDQAVLSAFEPKLDIVERQDRPDGSVVWLRTSKVPYRAVSGPSGTVGGFDVVSAARAAELSKKLRH